MLCSTNKIAFYIKCYVHIQVLRSIGLNLCPHIANPTFNTNFELVHWVRYVRHCFEGGKTNPAHTVTTCKADCVFLRELCLLSQVVYMYMRAKFAHALHHTVFG